MFKPNILAFSRLYLFIKVFWDFMRKVSNNFCESPSLFSAQSHYELWHKQDLLFPTTLLQCALYHFVLSMMHLTQQEWALKRGVGCTRAHVSSKRMTVCLHSVHFYCAYIHTGLFLLRLLFLPCIHVQKFSNEFQTLWVFVKKKIFGWWELHSHQLATFNLCFSIIIPP